MKMMLSELFLYLSLTSSRNVCVFHPSVLYCMLYANVLDSTLLSCHPFVLRSMTEPHSSFHVDSFTFPFWKRNGVSLKFTSSKHSYYNGWEDCSWRIKIITKSLSDRFILTQLELFFEHWQRWCMTWHSTTTNLLVWFRVKVQHIVPHHEITQGNPFVLMLLT